MTYFRDTSGTYYAATDPQAERAARWLGLRACAPPPSLSARTRFVPVSAAGGLFRVEDGGP